jgi:uncharacterized repeat protein (TIGR03803 family)
MKTESILATCKSLLLFAFVLGLVPFSTSKAQAQTFSAIYRFGGGTDGGRPFAGLLMNSAGILYGTTSVGGTFGAGVVFEMTENGKEKVLYNFTGGADGANPYSSLIMDTAGNLYGTTWAGGAYGAGTVFKVTGETEKVLYSFTGGTDGANPEASLAMDATGNLYGTTFAGGAYGGGTVFEVVKSGNKEKVLYSFGEGTDGANPVAGVTLGTTKGQLYGTTSAGGAYGDGIVFQLTGSSSSWKEKILHTFEMQSDGGTPYAGLVFDQSGNLYGAATSGGDGGGGGTVFELTPAGSRWNFTVIYGLPGWSLSGTFRNLLVDASGNIYGTTHCDGTYQSGTVYELTPSGGTWTYTSLYVFTGGSSDGQFAYSNLVMDKRGNLYGTTAYSAYGFGDVFKVTP